MRFCRGYFFATCIQRQDTVVKPLLSLLSWWLRVAVQTQQRKQVSPTHLSPNEEHSHQLVLVVLQIVHGGREVSPNRQLNDVLLRNDSHRKQRGKYRGVSLSSCLSPGGKSPTLCHRELPCSIQDGWLVLLSSKWVSRYFLRTGKGKSPFEAKQMAGVLSFLPEIMSVKSSLPWHERPRSSYCLLQ